MSPPRLNVVGGCIRRRAIMSVSSNTSTSVVVVHGCAGFGLTASRMTCGARALALLKRSAIAVSRVGAGIVSVQASMRESANRLRRDETGWRADHDRQPPRRRPLRCAGERGGDPAVAVDPRRL